MDKIQSMQLYCNLHSAHGVIWRTVRVEECENTSPPVISVWLTLHARYLNTWAIIIIICIIIMWGKKVTALIISTLSLFSKNCTIISTTLSAIRNIYLPLHGSFNNILRQNHAVQSVACITVGVNDVTALFVWFLSSGHGNTNMSFCDWLAQEN